MFFGQRDKQILQLEVISQLEPVDSCKQIYHTHSRITDIGPVFSHWHSQHWDQRDPVTSIYIVIHTVSRSLTSASHKSHDQKLRLQEESYFVSRFEFSLRIHGVHSWEECASCRFVASGVFRCLRNLVSQHLTQFAGKMPNHETIPVSEDFVFNFPHVSQPLSEFSKPRFPFLTLSTSLFSTPLSL